MLHQDSIHGTKGNDTDVCTKNQQIETTVINRGIMTLKASGKKYVTKTLYENFVARIATFFEDVAT